MKRKVQDSLPSNSKRQKKNNEGRRKIKKAKGNHNSLGVQEKTQEEVKQFQSMVSDSIVDKSMLTKQTFSKHPNMSEASKRAVTNLMGLTHMTEVQSKTFDAVAEGKDVLARARTGTGKTLAFLLPSLEVLLKHMSNNSHSETSSFQPGKSIGMLVISPTRELATQIAKQAKQLLTYHDKRKFSTQVIYGGIKLKKDTNALSEKIPTILVATPGRLMDHLQSTEIDGTSFSDLLSPIRIMVLDETDRLLDMGFRREIEKIISYLPSVKQTGRQTLLFSATMPKELKPVMSQTMRKGKSDSVIVDCINDKDASTVTNSHIVQTHVVIPSIDDYIKSLVLVVLKAIHDKDSGAKNKIIVFFPTANLVAFFSEIFNKGLGIPIIEIHSRINQNKRNKASEKFRSSYEGILFTSDVSARGVDYPDTSHVIQFGLPDSKETYLHRLGRTGRAGKKGKGWLMLCPFETKFLLELKKGDNIIKLPENKSLLSDKSLTIESNKKIERLDSYLRKVTERSKGAKDLEDSASKAYQSVLGYYKQNMKRTSINGVTELVQIANEISRVAGLIEPPALQKRTLGKMGLKGVRGIRVDNTLRNNNRNR